MAGKGRRQSDIAALPFCSEKITFFLFLASITVLMLCSCTGAKEKNQTQSTVPADWRSVSIESTEDSEYREEQRDQKGQTAEEEHTLQEYRLDESLCFSVPSAWNLFMQTDDSFSFDPEDLFFEAKRLGKNQCSSGRDAMDSVLSVWSEDYSIVSEENISLCGQEAVLLGIEQSYSENIIFLYDAAVLETEEWFYVLYLQTSEEGAEESEEYFPAILDSVTVKNGSISENGTGEENEIPEYKGNSFEEIHENVPYFKESEFTTSAYKRFSDLDSLGRCGTAMACLGPETMPTEARSSIGMIKPSGWHTVKYDGIDGNYLYNRCHLIAFQLCGENANELNLITGTRYMNTQGMEPFESSTASYIERTGNHVLYRVTPVYDGDDLVAQGVLMEAQSVEDDDYAFCIFCYNIQPGIVIDYSTGDSRQEE